MDWNSSALWGIIGLIGGFIISFIFYKIGIKNKKLIYTKNSQVLITNNLSEINGLNITYQNQPIKDLTSTTITIKSIGKDIISTDDFGKATPLCIKTDGKFFLQNDIYSIIVQNSNSDNLIEPILKDNSTILLNFDYFSQGDEITFILLHTETIDICGKLKTGVLLNNNLFSKTNTIKDILIQICTGILLLLFFSRYMFYSGISGVIINGGNFLFNLLLGVTLLNYFKKLFNNLNNIEINISDSDNSNIRF